jgi:hypothetical protein
MNLQTYRMVVAAATNHLALYCMTMTALDEIKGEMNMSPAEDITVPVNREAIERAGSFTFQMFSILDCLVLSACSRGCLALMRLPRSIWFHKSVSTLYRHMIIDLNIIESSVGPLVWTLLNCDLQPPEGQLEFECPQFLSPENFALLQKFAHINVAADYLLRSRMVLRNQNPGPYPW